MFCVSTTTFATAPFNSSTQGAKNWKGAWCRSRRWQAAWSRAITAIAIKSFPKERKPFMKSVDAQEAVSGGPGLILVNPKYLHNIAAAIRAASCFDVSRLVWTGSRIDFGPLERLPREERMKGYKDVVWTHDKRDKPFRLFVPDITPVCVELLESSEPLTTFD